MPSAFCSLRWEMVILAGDVLRVFAGTPLSPLSPQVGLKGCKPQKVKEHIGAEPQPLCTRDVLYLLQHPPWVLLVLNKPQALVQPELTEIGVAKHRSLQKQDSDLSEQPILDGFFSEGPR